MADLLEAIALADRVGAEAIERYGAEAQTRMLHENSKRETGRGQQMYPDLRLRPWTVKRADALAFVRETHRRLPRVQGAMWCVSVRSGDEIVGVALVGWPSQEQTCDEMDHLRVLRVAVKEGYKNACSMLYGACWRAARAMGVTSMDTFTHLDEPGTSLRAAGWIEDGTTDGGEYDRPSRRRARQVDAAPKRRWWAPGSEKLTVKRAAEVPRG